MAEEGGGHVLLTMNTLNRADSFSGFFAMRGVLALISCLAAALALSGGMGRTARVAVAPQSSLDTIAYGHTYSAAPAPIALAYAEPAPVRYDVAYHLDAGDRLRVVVYG